MGAGGFLCFKGPCGGAAFSKRLCQAVCCGGWCTQQEKATNGVMAVVSAVNSCVTNLCWWVGQLCGMYYNDDTVDVLHQRNLKQEAVVIITSNEPNQRSCCNAACV